MMNTKIEIERKFLVKFPESWSSLVALFDQLIDIKRISQTYLKPKNGEPSPRIRKTIAGLSGDTDIIYDYNQKYFIENGINKEFEKEITENQYKKYIEDSLPNKFTLEKTRFLFKYKDQIFELDVFKGPLKGLAILEIELKNQNQNQKIELTPYLKYLKEVTSDKKFSQLPSVQS